jgi:hypothetical protein
VPLLPAGVVTVLQALADLRRVVIARTQGPAAP